MSSIMEEIPASVLAVLELPRLETLAVVQMRGASCAWCAQGLTGETAVPLGEHMALSGGSSSDSAMRCFPRACRACVADRAHRGLFAHATACTLCARRETAGTCEIGRGLYRLVREYR